MLRHFDQLYCKTHQEARAMGLYLLDYETSPLDKLEGVYLVMPLAKGANQCRENKAFYLTGGQDIELCVKKITTWFKPEQRDSYPIRNPYSIYFDMEESRGPKLVSAMISFERFESVNDILKQFDWVYPMVAWSKNRIYFRSYTKHCYETNTIPTSTLSPFRVVYQIGQRWCVNPNYANKPGTVHCSECASYGSPYMGLYDPPMVYEDFLNDVLNDSEYFMHTIEAAKPADLYPNECSLSFLLSTYIDLHKDLDIKSLVPSSTNINILSRDELIKLFAKSGSPCLEVLSKPLPFEYVKPVSLDLGLCSRCFDLYKPPFWYYENMTYYSSECANLYLCFEKYDVPWDIVVVIMCFKSAVEYYSLP